MFTALESLAHDIFRIKSELDALPLYRLLRRWKLMGKLRDALALQSLLLELRRGTTCVVCFANPCRCKAR